jgi:hypothetical protein
VTAPGAPAAASAAQPITFKARELITWAEPPYRVFVAHGEVDLRYDTKTVTANDAVLWFDETRPKLTGVIALDIYLEGDVKVEERGATIKSEREYFHVETLRRFLVRDADGVIPEHPQPVASDLLIRARAARQAEAVAPAPTPRPTVPLYPAPQAARQQLLQARYQAYALNSQGFDVQSWKDEDGRQVFIITGGVDIIRDVPGKEITPATEGREAPETAPPAEGASATESPRAKGSTASKPGAGQPAAGAREAGAPTKQGGAANGGAGGQGRAGARRMELTADNLVTWVPMSSGAPGGEQLHTEVYAEGNVTIYHLGRVVECDRIFYDLTDDRAVILDATIRTTVRQGQVPVYYRAKEIRQVNANQYVAPNGIITTCEFAHPHYWLQTQQLTLDESEDRRLAQAWNNVLFIEGLPVWYWPYYAHDINRDRFILKRLRLGQSSQFGTEVRTAWDLYDLANITNDWSNLNLVTDVLSKRGVGLGLDFDYRRWGGEGYFTSYSINDQGQDVPGVPLEDTERGRFEWRHRQQLSPYDTILAEFSWMSDRNFLKQYFRQEAQEDKEKETVLYYKHQEGLSAFTALGTVRVNDFQTQTEYLPQLGYRLLGYPVGYSLWGDRLTFYSTTQLANVRLMPDEALHQPQPDAWRFDTLNEVDMPLAWRFIQFVPFAGARYTAYTDSPDALGQESGTAIDRFAGEFGFRSSATFSRVYHVTNRLLDLDGIRHIITPTVDYFNRYDVTTTPNEVFHFDEVDPLGEYQVVTLGLRQLWQTRRLSRGRSPVASVDQRVVDWLLVDAKLDVFPNPDRDNKGDTLGDLRLNLIWRLSDQVTVLSKSEVDLANGSGWDVANVTLKLDRSPRLSFYVGERFIREADSSALTFGYDYLISQKWRLGALWQYDFQKGSPLVQSLVLTRRLHCWLLEVSFKRDEGALGGQGDTSVSMTLVPEVSPRTHLRFF